MRRTAGSITLFPNPAHERIGWEPIEGASRVVVYDALGQLVITEVLNTNAAGSVDISALPSGPYAMTLLNAAGVPLAQSRFVKAQAPIAR